MKNQTRALFDSSNVLTTGGSGMVGSYIDFGTRPSEEELDILDADAIAQTVARYHPTTIIHLAGATDMARCESDPDYAFRLNVTGTYRMARAARDCGATFVYLSTSRVFNGEKKEPYTENDVPDPRGAYAESKYMGELIVQALVPNHLIIRTAWVFGGGPERDNKFYGKVIRQLEKGSVKALADVRGSPTYGKDLIEAIQDLLRNGERGVFHVANEGSATRYDIARTIADRLKPDAEVRAVERRDMPGASQLPANESVSSAVALRPWQEALAEYLTAEW